MEIRVLKIILVVFVALQAFLYATQNIVNLDAAYQAVAYVTGNTGHEVYPASMGPALGHPALVWAALILILTGEYAVAVLAGKGAWDLWRARRGPPDEFYRARKFAVLGCGMALIVWFGLFSVIGGAYFQMWQTEVGANSLQGAFWYLMNSGLVLLFVNMRDE